MGLLLRAAPLAWGLITLSFSAFADSSFDARLLPAPQLRIENENGWYARTRGRFEMDAVHIRDDNANHTGGIYDRRARVGLVVGNGDAWSATAELDFADEEGQFTDVALQYHNQQNMVLQFGNFKEAFGMERTDSSASVLFIERAAVDIFTPQRNLGAQATFYDERRSFAIGAFTDSFESNSNKDKWAVTSRVTHSWEVGTDGLLHLGLAGSYREMEKVSYSTAPDTASTSIDILSTGTFYDVDTLMQAGLEAAYGYQNILVSGEYIATHLDRTAAEDATLDGGYLQVGWLLSGEDYTYSTAKKAIFQPVTPAQDFDLRQGTWGAWELGLRYQALSLNDGSIRAGNMHAVTGGLNWYPNSYWRVSSALTYATSDAEAVTPHDNPVIAALRLRVAF